MRDTLVGSLNGRYLVALGLVALLVLLNELLVQPSLLAILTDAPIINVAGRQRMLSQRRPISCIYSRIRIGLKIRVLILMEEEKLDLVLV